jgi:F0F1-type ATP synthase membrane subunit c/vacuolar-type H+-ATPase subunit K
MSKSANPQLPLYFAFFSMPFLMGLMSHFMVPPGDHGFAVALPDGSSALHVAALGLAAALMVGSVAVGAFAKSTPPGPERRQPELPLSWLVRLGMGESIALLGFAVTLVTRLPGAWVPFSVFSFLALLAARPRVQP